MAISERTRLTFTAIAVILVGVITGLLLGSALASGTPPTKTFNIVPYHWEYALFDEDWNEIEQMEVKRGTTVRLVAFPQSALPDEIRAQLWKRVADKSLEEIEAAYNEPTETNHGVFIGQLNVDLRPIENASTLEEAIDSVEFMTDAIGSYDMLCSVACGVGHPEMRLNDALVVK